MINVLLAATKIITTATKTVNAVAGLTYAINHMTDFSEYDPKKRYKKKTSNSKKIQKTNKPAAMRRIGESRYTVTKQEMVNMCSKKKITDKKSKTKNNYVIFD